jgi:phosphoribosyl-AMP cyclohydrolase
MKDGGSGRKSKDHPDFFTDFFLRLPLHIPNFLSMQTLPDLSALRFNADGLIPAIIQQAPAEDGGASSDEPPAGRVLMMAWMNQTSLEATLATGEMHYWSRSRKKLWLKGETSGHRQTVVEWRRDCDGDTLLFLVRQHGGGACHTGYESCFFQRLNADGSPAPIEEPRRFDPEAVYKPAS